MQLYVAVISLAFLRSLWISGSSVLRMKDNMYMLDQKETEGQ